jgi:site-specific DNA recombinase
MARASFLALSAEKQGRAIRAGLYTRISKDDPDDPRLGVQRQEADLRREAHRLGARMVVVLEDNDRSGSGKVARPDFERLIELIRNGELDLVMAIDLDRLTRGWEPFVQLYEACQEARITVAWLGGSANFRTGDGLLEMELRASFAREELRKIRKRTQRKHIELAERGKDAGGGRPFGYLADRHTLRPPYSYCRLSDRAEIMVDEPDLVREAADRALSNEPLRSICRDWEARGILPVNGSRWAPTVLRRILVSARISGRRELCTVDGRRSLTGEITATADWPAIITGDQSDRLRALLMAPERAKEAHPRKYLLSGGLLRCGLCGKQLHSIAARGVWRSYGCISGPGFSGGCGRLRIGAEGLERLVEKALMAAVDEGALTRALRAHEDDSGSRDELLRVEARLEELARDWARGEITRKEWQSARNELVAQSDALRATLEAQHRRLSLEGVESVSLPAVWPDMPLLR